MDTKITSIDEKRKNKQLNSKKFSIKYQKIDRELLNLSPQNIPDKLRSFYPPDTEDQTYAVTEESPFSNYNLLHEVDLSQFLQKFNPVLLYRVMKMMYGDPDIVGAYINRKSPDSSKMTVYGGVDWSYSLQSYQNIIAEVRSSNLNTRFKLRFWSRDMPNSDSAKKSIGRIMADCAKTLNEDLLKNLHVFSHSDEERLNENLTYSFQNLFSEKYQSAEKMLVVAKLMDERTERHQLEFNEDPEVPTSGFMYCASALFFIIAFESLIGMIYELLRRDEYISDMYDRVTDKADLDIRLATMHLYCNGFAKQIINRESPEWGMFQRLRDFRNNIMHGNLKGDHRVYQLVEDGITFFYGPAIDFMGQKRIDNKVGEFPLFMSSIDESVVKNIKETVDSLINCIILAMDEETKKWTEGWIDKAILNVSKKSK